jgi:nitroreductase
MEFQDVIHKRKMIRSYLDKPVERETVDFILENAIRAPSAGFSQGWGFLVLDEPEDLKRFWESNWPDRREDSRWPTMEHAPVIIIPLAHKQAYLDRYAEPDKGWTDKDEARWPVPFWIIDTAFAAENILLTVTDLGLGALFFGVDTPRFREAFGVPEAYEPIGAISIGHPAPGDRKSPSLKRGRREIDEVVRRGRWS